MQAGLRTASATQSAIAASVHSSGGHGGGAAGIGRGGGGGGGGNGDVRGGGGGDGEQPRRKRWGLPAQIGAGAAVYLGGLWTVAAVWDAWQDAISPRVDTSRASVSVVIPAINEERVIADTVRHVLTQWDPPPLEVIVADGGSTDGTVAAARRAGARIVRCGRGRALQMNAGAQVAAGQLLLFLHADTRLPTDAVACARHDFSIARTVLVGFRPLILDGGRPMWFSTANNWAKTYYGPMLLRPASYVRGLRIMFGDQGLSCRAVDFRAVGGYRAYLPLMEDAELCLDLHNSGPAAAEAAEVKVVATAAAVADVGVASEEGKGRPAHKSSSGGGGCSARGRVRMRQDRAAATSGRRIAAWGELRANCIFAYISMLWLAGAAPAELHAVQRRLYTDIR
ncbi:hypothetical protein HYH02_002048 [Chlamydomonas schloesseri]|uniref:Glycosyltransferase 2-like domain-containing protein n=1 Tax=Chlamydomonas schloesseri TaxID=2026947 RepID=A0A835WWB9_9CHLO|nr:hypothetical protein HYH02_002048 [Chlamydomonas schloesseri]|eukprot:KAG2453841.1 hypothetical protein HYH02_002048 [Chlamydomonas schloesseri]